MFGNEDLNRLVECAGRALESEDRYLVHCASERHWRGGPIGISDNINERYYQFVVWRALMASFPWRPRTERQRYDLAFYNDVTNEPVAFAQIKRWWSVFGEAELRGIRRDLEKLGTRRIPGVMLILTWHSKAKAEDNFRWLAEKLGVSRDDIVTYSFDTLSPDDDHPTEFAVIGFLVAQKALPASA